MSSKQRFYHRFLRPEDLPQLESASAGLFAFDPQDVNLNDIINSDRWFCLAAVTSSAAAERIIGFIAAALGAVREFEQEQQYLEQSLCEGLDAAATGDTAAVVGSYSSSTQAATDQTITISTSSSSSNSNPDINSGSQASAADALALEVVLLGVSPEFRRRGVASRLLQQARAHATAQGASLIFLHVQDTNTPAQQLYRKAGFARAAVLPGYYSKQLLSKGSVWGQLGRASQDPDDSVANKDSQQGSGTASVFSGVDAELLVLKLDSSSCSTFVVVQQNDNGAAVSHPSASRISSDNSSSRRADTAVQIVPESPLPSAGSPNQQQLQQIPSQAPSEHTSTSRTPAVAPMEMQAAGGAVAAAAAAAARVLFGPAVRLLGLGGQQWRGSWSRGGAAGKRGSPVQVGGEWMVQVREGRDVYVYDPDDMPADVLLSDADKAVVQRQQARQKEWQQQQQQSKQHSQQVISQPEQLQARIKQQDVVQGNQQQQQHSQSNSVDESHDDNDDDDSNSGAPGLQRCAAVHTASCACAGAGAGSHADIDSASSKPEQHWKLAAQQQVFQQQGLPATVGLLSGLPTAQIVAPFESRVQRFTAMRQTSGSTAQHWQQQQQWHQWAAKGTLPHVLHQTAQGCAQWLQQPQRQHSSSSCQLHMPPAGWQPAQCTDACHNIRPTAATTAATRKAAMSPKLHSMHRMHMGHATAQSCTLCKLP